MAKSKELTVEQKLKGLYDLQQIDSKIDEIGVLKGELPMEVNDLEDEIIGLRTRLTNLENTIKKYQDEVARYFNTEKEAETLILKYEAQQNEVSNNREFEALSKEIELQRLEIQLAQKKSKGSKALMGEKDIQLQDLKGKIEKQEKELEEKKVELEKIIADTDKEETTLKKKSERSKKHVEDRLLNAYVKIRHAYRNGLAVVTVARNSCGGCFNRIPPQTQLELGQRKKIIVCEHCGRILVDERIMTSLVDLEREEAEAAAQAALEATTKTKKKTRKK